MATTLHIVLIIALILFVPILFRKMHLPGIVGLILAGVAIGPYGFGIVERDATMQLFSNIGLYYIMFTSGIEIDLNDFRRNSRDTLVFSSYTFLIPLISGFLISFFIMRFSIAASILLAAMFASHTLMTYPVVSRYGIQRNPTVAVTVAGTMIAVTLSLVIIATISSFGTFQNAGSAYRNLSGYDAMLTALYLLLFIVYFLLMPRLAHLVFKQTNDSILQFTFVMLVIFAAVALAQLAGLEGILGAFLAGLALNRLIPNLSPLMTRISFVGNAVFIPLFLISVGMLVDLSAFTHGWNTLIVAAVMTAIAITTKWLAAWATQRTCNYNKFERQLIFGLSGAKAAVSLAAVMIGYNIIDTQGNHLFTADVLNGTVVMILITCTISSIITEYAARRLGALDSKNNDITNALSQDANTADSPTAKTILLPLANPANSEHLLNLALLCAEPKRGDTIAALRVVKNSDMLPQAEQQLLHVAQLANAADRSIACHTQVAANIANGIAEMANNMQIQEIIIGANNTEIELEDLNMLHDGKRIVTYGHVINQLISNQSRQISIYKPAQPVNTIQRMLVTIPPQAEKESGFLGAYEQIRQLTAQIGCKTIFYADHSTTAIIQALASRPKKQLTAQYHELDAWEDFLLIAKQIKSNDMLVVLQARQQTASYNPLFIKMPYMLFRFFRANSWLVIYPQQNGTATPENKLI